MREATSRKISQSSALLLGIGLTLLALPAHHFLPKRSLTLDGARTGAVFFLMPSEAEAPGQVQWVDQDKFHYTCRFAKSANGPTCSFTYLLYSTNADHGTDLSRYRTLKLSLRYAGNARYVRISIRNFDPRFSRVEDANSSKFNSINVDPKDFDHPLSIALDEFTVPEWWLGQYNVPRAQSHPDLSNATALSFDLQGELPGTNHDIQIDGIEFTGDWISAEYWYLGIVCTWLLLATLYGVSQWLSLHRAHREQRKKIHDLVDTNAQLQDEKEEYRKLSTLDGLTRILNRHGIDQFVASLRSGGLPASVIIADLDLFKRVNDSRGHHVGDCVLQAVGEILRTQTRSSDGVGRWGGEEFVLVCPGASLAQATELAEKLRRKIMETNFVSDHPLFITSSFGVAACPADQEFDDAIREADQALYLAKSRGRNCVVAASDEQMHTVTGTRKGAWAVLSDTPGSATDLPERTSRRAG